VEIKTFGDLCRAARAAGANWLINPAISDADPIPTFKRGGKPPAAKPEQVLTQERFLALVSRPSPNPLINKRRGEAGYLDERGGSTGLHARFVPGGTPSGQPLPATVDWRNRFGWPWTTSIQDQGCEDCWAFATAACIESMVRIGHCAWAKLSEAELREGCGSPCPDANNPNPAITYAANNGLSDEMCVPYTENNPPLFVCADHSGRSVKIDITDWNNNQLAPGSADGYALQKQYLDLVGPLITYLVTTPVWDGYLPAGSPEGSIVIQDYPGISPGPNDGGHFVLIVGYDDTQSPPAWIVKNSWGTGWGLNGFGYLAYGACQSDTYGQGGLSSANPDPSGPSGVYIAAAWLKAGTEPLTITLSSYR
jgi:Papain family cysteine protease